MLVENNIREIGSAIANLSPALRERNPHTDWKTLDIIRNLAAQDKGTIDPAILWDFGTKKLPVVRGQILQMIDDEYALLE
ncbi:MAG: HepT-like ribonuclease domain-containing protein [Methanoregula sp.]